MSPAALSLLALIVAIGLSMTSRINVGLVSMALAWAVGVGAAGQSADAIVRGFPSSVFLTLTGVTLLFAAAMANGTLEQLAGRVVRLAGGTTRGLPLVFSGAAGLVSAAGPGAISSTALVAPLAMAIGGRAGVPPLLTALMVANGANAGNLSPISAVGVIANDKMAAAGLGGHAGKVFLANFVASLLVAGVAGLMGSYLHLWKTRLGNDVWRRFPHSGKTTPDVVSVVSPEFSTDRGTTPLRRQHILTLVVIALWIAGVVAFKLPIGLSAVAAAVVLLGARAADEAKAVALVPWGVILMVTGVSMLVALLETTGGMDLFASALARLATPGTINGVVALVTGGISIYSSTSGVVLPAFLPTVPALVGQVGGGDPLAVALSINVGSSLVDVSPLSTLGALCLAAAPNQADARPLFRQLLMWGIAMAFAGAVLCQVLAGVLASW